MAPDSSSKSTNILSRILATAAIWAIVIVFAERIKVRQVDIILLVLGIALTVAIWVNSSPEERN